MSKSEEQRETLRRQWNQLVPVFKRAQEFVWMMERPVGEVMVERLQLGERARVLDVATGSGDAGFQAARRIPGGTVIGVDIGDEVAQLAMDNARNAGISNFEARGGDACALPFPEGSFEGVMCRLGIGLFSDPQLSAREMVRVLVPGGRVAIASWGPEEHNPWMSAVTQTIDAIMDVPPAAPGSPSMYRHSASGSLRGLLEGAGAVDVVEEKVEVASNFESPEKYWDIVKVATPGVARLYATATLEQRSAIDCEVLGELRKQSPGGGPMVARGLAWVAHGSKPR
jgi:ubiquinone/menaquinone biosynthesis C-methylase UbiE